MYFCNIRQLQKFIEIRIREAIHGNIIEFVQISYKNLSSRGLTSNDNSLSNILQWVNFEHQFRRFPCTNIVEYSKTKPLFGKCKGLKSFKGLSLVEKMNILTISMCLLYSHTEANYSISQLSHSTKEGCGYICSYTGSIHVTLR